MGSCVNALRIVTFLFNFAFWLSGVVVFGLGIWLLFDPAASDFFALHSTHPGAFRYVGWFLVGAGAIIILVGYFGCIGAWRMNQCALAFFCCILIIAFFLELAAAVTLFHKQEHVKHYVESSMYDTIRNRYSSETAFKNAFDTVQEQFECCGVKTYTDWLSARWDAEPAAQVEINEEDAGRIEHGIGAFGGNKGTGYGRVPSSCCNEHGKLSYPNNCGRTFNQAPLNTYAQFINTRGCADAVYESVSSYLNTIVGVCVILCVVQLLGVVLSMTLCCCKSSEKK
ncbi:Protein CBR-TSP-8 [Caenorhabditis briggsae]|uniref:Tetraspanin n=2 Tax=Caenorhabditis briggsae TaxID=6238 RepID=A0AAE8ZTU4_CAEBR|nr:Protein CBR-TSP-8 [Caenorhabditis briggsae]ULT84636.1 hypothetical protein L3Y34_013351 [Caenorhabditis briggsae]CAP27546.1 Protein CBR-TSP-8 [Caenorhabditis briggsae]